MRAILKAAESRWRDAAPALLRRVRSPRKVAPAELGRLVKSGAIRKMLLVRTYQGLGDWLCATPVLSNLKEAFPGLSLHVLANTFNRAALDGNPRVEKIREWNERRSGDPFQWLRLAGSLRRERYDLAIVLSSNAVSLTAIALALFSGARLIAGYDTTPYGREWGGMLYDCEIPYENPRHEVDKFLGLLTALGLPCPRREPEYFTGPDDEAFAADFLGNGRFSPGKPRVGLFLGGKVDRPERIWPPRCYAELVRLLTQNSQCGVVLIAPPRPARSRHRRNATFWLDEHIHEESFRREAGRELPVFRDPELARVAALLKRLDLVICPDGGILHLAAAAGARVLGLFFGTDPERWLPPVPNAWFLKAPEGRPEGLSAGTVAGKAAELLRVRA